jgi:hypothetical protein
MTTKTTTQDTVLDEQRRVRSAWRSLLKDLKKARGRAAGAPCLERRLAPLTSRLDPLIEEAENELFAAEMSVSVLEREKKAGPRRKP